MLKRLARWILREELNDLNDSIVLLYNEVEELTCLKMQMLGDLVTLWQPDCSKMQKQLISEKYEELLPKPTWKNYS
jgi:hypothetical protein